MCIFAYSLVDDLPIENLGRAREVGRGRETGRIGSQYIS